MTDKPDSINASKQMADRNAEEHEAVASTKISDQNINTESDHKKTTKKHRTSKSNKSIAYEFFLFFAVLGFIAAAVYYLEQQLKEQSIHTRLAIDEQVKKWEPRISELEQTNYELQQTITQLSDSHNQLSESFSTLIKSSRHSRNDWLLAEVEYLLSVANNRLLFARDVDSAIVAMQTADVRLRDMAYPAIVPVRKQLAEDINQLKVVPQIDISGMSLALNALIESVDKLELLAPGADLIVEREMTPAIENKIENWRELPEAVWADIKKLVVVREHHGKVKPLIAPEEMFFLKQNLILKLEQAQLALLKNNAQIYVQHLQSASDWIREYFKAESPATQSVLRQIAELQGKEIDPALPDISSSYQAVKNFREQQANVKNGEGKL